MSTDISAPDLAAFDYAAACSYGAVLIGGIGSGELRARIVANEAVTASEAVDVDEIAVAGQHSEEPHIVRLDDLEDRAEEAVTEEESWQTVVIDVDDPAAEASSTLHATLRELLTTPEGRVVLVTTDPSLEISGFRKLIGTKGDDYTVVIFQRWDPAHGIGVEDVHAGMVRRVGWGWCFRDQAVLTLDGQLVKLDGQWAVKRG